MPSWDPDQYLRFAAERTRPCYELAARVEIAAPRGVIDLGCGPGNSIRVLAERWPGAQLVGMDSSAEMIAAARREFPTCEWRVGDVAAWAARNDETFDVVFSNAALQWLPDHATLYPQLLSRVAPGGALAVQVPHNFDSPPQQIARALAVSTVWRSLFPAGGVRSWHVHEPTFYYDLLAPQAARIDLWETEYQLVMPDAAAIVDWYKGSGLRPFLEALASTADRDRFTAEYLVELQKVFPLRADGRVLFPFRRLFLIAWRSA